MFKMSFFLLAHPVDVEEKGDLTIKINVYKYKLQYLY